MKILKDISFWCIVLAIVVVMVVHHMLSKGQVIEGNTNGEGEEETQGDDRVHMELTLTTGGGGVSGVGGGGVSAHRAGEEVECDEECQAAREQVISDLESRLDTVQNENQNNQNALISAGEILDQAGAINLPTGEETAYAGYSVAENGPVDCSNKTFLGIADTIRHEGHSANWGNQMIDLVESTGRKVQDFKDRGENIPCENYYYYKPQTSGDSGWSEGMMSLERDEAPAGFYTLQHHRDDLGNQQCTNDNVRLNNSNILNNTCSDQSSRPVAEIDANRAVISAVADVDVGADPATDVLEQMGNDDSVTGGAAISQGLQSADTVDTVDTADTADTVDPILPEDETSPACVPSGTAASDGLEHHVKGYFNASCGEGENDYCRFVESGGYVRSCTEDSDCDGRGSCVGGYCPEKWLSCMSPENECQEFPLSNSRYSWTVDQITPTSITTPTRSQSSLAEKTTSLKNFFANECQLGEKCPTAINFPDKGNCPTDGCRADPDAAGSTGHRNRARGFFNASCNNDDDGNGVANDYCRFVGEEGNGPGIWLSCISPRSPENGVGQRGCNNKFPRSTEKYGWRLDDIDSDTAKESFDPDDDVAVEAANNALASFFSEICNRQVCDGDPIPAGGCELHDSAGAGSSQPCEMTYMAEQGGSGFKQCEENSDGDCVPKTDKCWEPRDETDIV